MLVVNQVQVELETRMRSKHSKVRKVCRVYGTKSLQQQQPVCSEEPVTDTASTGKLVDELTSCQQFLQPLEAPCATLLPGLICDTLKVMVDSAVLQQTSGGLAYIIHPLVDGAQLLTCRGGEI